MLSAVTLYIASAMMLRAARPASPASPSALPRLSWPSRHGVCRCCWLSWVLAQLSLFVGFTLLIVPGMFLFVCYLVLLPVVLFEHPNPVHGAGALRAAGAAALVEDARGPRDRGAGGAGLRAGRVRRC